MTWGFGGLVTDCTRRPNENCDPVGDPRSPGGVLARRRARAGMVRGRAGTFSRAGACVVATGQARAGPRFSVQGWRTTLLYAS